MSVSTIDWWGIIRRRFGIDTRALGVARIGLGLLLLADLFVRASDLRAHYTDAGVLPRWGLLSESSRLSFHLSAGTVEGVALLFALQALVAVAFLIGYRTRLATVLTWVFWLSLHARMPLVLNGGDTLLRITLFWAMFVPMGARFSIDAVRNGGRTEQVFSIGTVAILAEVIVMYASNAILKHTGEIWPRGDAVAVVMQLDMFTTPVGDILGQYPPVLTAITLFIVALWTVSPLLLLTTGWLRAVCVVVFMGTHLGMATAMHLGLFPFIAVAVLSLFLPAVVWERVVPHDTGNWTPTVAHKAATDWYPTISTNDEQTQARLRRGLRYSALAVAVVSLVFVGLFNAQSITSETEINDEQFVPDIPDPLRGYAQATMLVQHWNMFAPNPVRDDGWYVIPANLTNGSTVDIYRGSGPVSMAKPDDVSATYANQRWRKYLLNLRLQSHENYRLYYGQYLCREWNQNHEVRVVSFQMRYVREMTTTAGEEESRDSVTIWYHNCF